MCNPLKKSLDVSKASKWVSWSLLKCKQRRNSWSKKMKINSSKASLIALTYASRMPSQHQLQVVRNFALLRTHSLQVGCTRPNAWLSALIEEFSSTKTPTLTTTIRTFSVGMSTLPPRRLAARPQDSFSIRAMAGRAAPSWRTLQSPSRTRS